MRNISIISFASAAMLLSGCVAMSGNYVVTAADKQGKPLTNGLNLTATGRGIYTVRNALCSKYPGAVVTIKASQTNEELKSESPYSCK